MNFTELLLRIFQNLMAVIIVLTNTKSLKYSLFITIEFENSLLTFQEHILQRSRISVFFKYLTTFSL